MWHIGCILLVLNTVLLTWIFSLLTAIFTLLFSTLLYSAVVDISIVYRLCEIASFIKSYGQVKLGFCKEMDFADWWSKHGESLLPTVGYPNCSIIDAVSPKLFKDSHA